MICIVHESVPLILDLISCTVHERQPTKMNYPTAARELHLSLPVINNGSAEGDDLTSRTVYQ